MNDPRIEALTGALHEPYDHPRDDDSYWGTNGRCRACGEDGVWTRTIDTAAVLAALDAAGWTLEKKAEGDQIMVLSADHERLVGWVTFGKDEGTAHQHDLFAFHSHEEKP